MSFITKRERVFNEYDLYDLPARNEGKLKAYASCTDARAWSHFCSDKSEHLVEIIKRNNDTCRPKYVPTEAIVNTLMVGKNAEIARLKRKIEEFEQMLAVYDELDLTCDQKCEIAKAHAAIKAANKDLDELCLDLDLSGFTEGIDSEAFETGQSRGDEAPRFRDDETPKSKGDEWLPQKESKSNQVGGLSCPCDASTSAHDARVEQMQDTIVAKDAKLNAMKNTIAVMENDVCEPYCIYAHIYTALEKIFGILCQNEKYKIYLDLMTAGKDTRCIDIKGKILFKLKVLEKFCVALIAPCSQDLNPASQADCSCFRAEIVARVETTFALTSAESKQPNLDSKRAQLVADIMEHEEMKEILSKESVLSKAALETDEDVVIESYNFDTENLKRLKNLQENYDDLMTCYEALKHEKDCLQIRCRKYEELEKECECVRNQLKEYNGLWNEKEHYRKRSVNLDELKEQYFVLCDETSNLETQLKAESEINNVKTKTIEELRCANISLEKRLNEASIKFEKEKNNVLCKLKEYECTIMCQEQQIKSLSTQIDRLLEQDPEKGFLKPNDTPAVALIDEINSLKDQINNLKDALYCNEEEKQQLQEEYQNKLNYINSLKMEIEDWKSTYEKTLQRNEYLEKYTDNYRDEVQKLIEENKILSQDVDEKTTAIENLINIINNKSQEVKKLMDDVEKNNKEKNDLYNEIQSLHDVYNKSITVLDSEKAQAVQSLQISRQESKELLEKVKEYDDVIHKQDDLSLSYQMQSEECKKLKSLLLRTQEENRNLQMDLASRENNYSIMLQEIQRLREVNNLAVNNINSLQNENGKYKLSLELTEKDSKMFEEKLHRFEELSNQLEHMKHAHEKLLEEKNRFENELSAKTLELNNAIHSIQLTKKQSDELVNKLHQSESLKSDLRHVNEAYQKIMKEKLHLQTELTEKKQDFENLLESFNNLITKNDNKSKEFKALSSELATLKKSYDELLAEKDVLLKDFDNKTEEINNLYNTLERKIEENRELLQKIKVLELSNRTITNDMNSLQEENLFAKSNLHNLKKETEELISKVKHYEVLEFEFNELKKKYDETKSEKNKLEKELDKQIAHLNRVQEDNHALNTESDNLLSHSEDLEKALINARTELISKTSFPESPHMDIIKEIEKMKQEKTLNHNKIRDLLDKLDESENTIANLSEGILARDHKIAVLENHINELQGEVQRLHTSLAEIVDTGEQIRDNSYQRINESLKSMEAHHSRATHNMKMELAKLQNENMKLDVKLSFSKIKSEDSARETHKYISQLIHLQNEREVIVTDIKQLEIKSAGDSTLSPDKCDVEDILASLDRVRRHLDARSTKNTSLEHTLSKVQNSYQLVQSKADEAKKIVEKEKQKIINEKEEAIKDRMNMEKQLIDLKEQLQKQISNDKNVIKDLEAEILNQKLIIDKLNRSTQSYITKLKEEMQSLEDLYQSSLEKTSLLENKLQIMNQEKSEYGSTIDKVNKQLEEKCEEIASLKRDLETLIKKPDKTKAIQTLTLDNNKNIETQTNNELDHKDLSEIKKNEKITDFHDSLDISSIQLKLPSHGQKVIQEKQIHKNEVKILTVNVEPSFDYVRNSYLNYKLKLLSTCRLEHYSISSENMETGNDEMSVPDTQKSENYPPTNHKSHILNVIDLYNKPSMHTNSSKAMNNYLENEKDFKSPAKTSAFTESYGTKSSIGMENKTSTFFGPVSEVSLDKDLFVIYRDSEHSYAKNPRSQKAWPTNGRSEILVEAVTIYSDIDRQKKNNRTQNEQSDNFDIVNDPFLYAEEELNDDDSVKPKINIKLPRVEIDSPSMGTASDADKKSLDSYALGIYYLPRDYSSSEYKINDSLKIKENILKNKSIHSFSYDENQSNLGSNITSKNVMQKSTHKTTKHRKDVTNELLVPLKLTKQKPSPTFIKNKLESDSHHKLARVEADVRLIKNKTAYSENTNSSEKETEKTQNFALDYILDTAQHQDDPDYIKTYNAAKALRKSHSDERFKMVKLHGKSDSSPSRLSDLKKSSTDYKTISDHSQSKSSDKSKTYTEQSVLVKLDPIEEYESKIKHLNKHLENIEKDYKNKIEAIKTQYDINIKSILNEHNEGVKSIQGLHEETLQDIKKHHENEVENLRSMSIEAMRKAEKLEKENRSLKCKIQDCSCTGLDEEPIKMSTPELKRRRRSRCDTKMLTKTNVEAFNVRPKSRSHGPCTCSVDVNISDTIRNIFEQVDVEQRKMAELTYLKYIANKIMNGNVEALDSQELSFLHLKVCRVWKGKLTKEETLQKRIDSLEVELMNKQRHAQQNMAELDRKVAEERRRLQEVREAVCRNTPTVSRYDNPEADEGYVPQVPPPTAEKEFLGCNCNTGATLQVGERRSAGDLAPVTCTGRQKRTKPESNRATLAKLDAEERREKKLYNDEPPTRLRKTHDRQSLRPNKK